MMKLETTMLETTQKANGAGPQGRRMDIGNTRSRRDPGGGVDEPGLRPGGGMRPGPTLLQSLWRHRVLVVLATILGCALGYGAPLLPPPRYEASGRLFLEDPGEADVFDTQVRRDLDLTLHTNAEVQRLESLPVLTRAAELLGVAGEPAQLRSRFETQSSPELGLITISATGPTPEDATRLADSLATAYEDFVAQRTQGDAQRAIDRLSESTVQVEARIGEIAAALDLVPAEESDIVLESQLEARVAELNNLRARITELQVEAALFGAGVDLYEPAALPEAPAGLQPLSGAAAGGFLAFSAAALFAWWNAGRNRKVQSASDVQAVLDVPLLGSIPRFRHAGRGPSPVWTLSGVGASASEAYQFVAASLELAVEELGVTTVMITSAEPDEGKTVTVLNLATAASRPERGVAVVDADIRARALSSLAGAQAAPGLTDLGLSDLDVGAFTTRLRTRLTALAGERIVALVPGGSRLQDQAGFFRTTAFRKAMVKVKDLADFVLVDSPPLLAVSDSLTIASQVDAIVLVVSRGTDADRLAEARRRLDLVGAPLIGCVYNRDVGRAAPDYGYYGERKKGSKASRLAARFGRKRVGV